MLHGIINFNVIKHVKSNPSLLPLLGVTTFGVSMIILNVIRTLAFSPDIVIRKRSNPRPWNHPYDKGEFVYMAIKRNLFKIEFIEGHEKRYKLFSTSDYKTPKIFENLKLRNEETTW